MARISMPRPASTRSGAVSAPPSPRSQTPIEKVIVSMQGGKKGLIVNSRDLCEGKARANVRLRGHDGRRLNSRPVVRPKGCGGRGR